MAVAGADARDRQVRCWFHRPGAGSARGAGRCWAPRLFPARRDRMPGDMALPGRLYGMTLHSCRSVTSAAPGTSTRRHAGGSDTSSSVIFTWRIGSPGCGRPRSRPEREPAGRGEPGCLGPLAERGDPDTGQRGHGDTEIRLDGVLQHVQLRLGKHVETVPVRDHRAGGCPQSRQRHRLRLGHKDGQQRAADAGELVPGQRLPVVTPREQSLAGRGYAWTSASTRPGGRPARRRSSWPARACSRSPGPAAPASPPRRSG